MATKAKKSESPPVEYASAIDKIRDEMAKSPSRYVQVVGEFLTDYLLAHPEAEAAILAKDKSIAGSLSAMQKEAEKQKTGNVAVLDDATGFGIVLKYFGIEGTPAPKPSPLGTSSARETAQCAVSSEMGPVRPSVDFSENACVVSSRSDEVLDVSPTSVPDPFDLDALLGVT